MSTRLLGSALAALWLFILTLSSGWAATFSFGYKTVFDSNADTYVVGQENVRKYTEWQSPPTTYWGPDRNDVAAALTQRFTFAEPASEIVLKASLASFDFTWGGGTGKGSCSLWASKDGESWVQLLDNPVPNRLDSYKDYNQAVPASLLGSTSFWVQVRMQVSGTPNTNFTGARFGMSDTSRTDNVFQIDVKTSPQGIKPSVTTQPPSEIQTTSAVLNAKVAPNGSATDTYFEFGTTTDYGSVTPIQAIDRASTATVVSAPLIRLSPNTLYHYRIVASNSAGMTFGPDQTFLTDSPPDAVDPWQFNCFTLESFQAGSTTDFDDLKVYDLDNSSLVYSNSFSNSADATRGLTLYHYPKGSANPQLLVVNGSMTRVVNGQLRIETAGFGQNGGDSYNSYSFARYDNVLPRNFRVEFKATRLYSPGYMHFHVFHREASDTTPPGAATGALSRSHVLRFAAFGDRFQDFGLIYNGVGKPWAQKLTAPGGNPLTGHRFALTRQGNIYSWYLDDVFIGKVTLPDTAPIAILQPPSDQTVASGTSAIFNVEVLGSGPVSYQWRKGGNNIPGETTDTLFLQSVSQANVGLYDVIVSNSAGFVISSPAQLTVSEPFPPTATTSGATNGSATSATFNGFVNPKGLPTTVYFEYGPAVPYSSATNPEEVGSGTNAISFSKTITGLSHEPCHFRIVAVNSTGRAYGEDQVFIPPNRSPIAIADAVYAAPVTVDGGKILINVLANDSDPDGDRLSVVNVAPATWGAVAVTENNMVSYTPGPGYNSSDTFSYTITDGNGGSAAAVVTIVPAPAFAIYGVTKGGPVHGEPAGTTFSTFGVPSINSSGAIAFLASYRSASGLTRSGIFAGKPASKIVHTGDTVPGVSGATFKSLKDPVFNKDGHVAFSATIAGVKKNSDLGVWTNALTGELRLVAREGDAAAGAEGGTFSQFVHLALSDSGRVTLVATLTRGVGGVTAKNDVGVWTTDSEGALRLALREGDPLDLNGARKTVKNLAVFGAFTGSVGQRRGFNADGELLIRTGFTDGTQALLRADVAGALSPVVVSGGEIAETNGLQMMTFGLGILGDDGSSVFQTTLKKGANGVTRANSSAILKASGDGNLKLIMRAGDPIPEIPGAVLQTLGHPVANAEGELAFVGTMRVGSGGVVKSNDTAIWQCRGEGAPELLVREGDAAPGVQHGRFGSFNSLAFPNQAGAAFVGTLVRKEGVNESNDTGLWAQDRNGAIQMLLREGGKLEFDGVQKTVRSFSVLSTISGSPSQGHTYTDRGGFVCRIVFTDRSQGVFTIWLPVDDDQLAR